MLGSGSNGNGAPELALRGSEAKGHEGFEDVFGDGDPGELGEEGKDVDVGGLGDFDGGEARVAPRWRGRARSRRAVQGWSRVTYEVHPDHTLFLKHTYR